MSGAAAKLGLALLLACAPEPGLEPGDGDGDGDGEGWREGWDFAWHGEQVSVYGYGRTPAEACAGGFAALETQTRVVASLLGAEPGLHYDYRWLAEDAWRGRCAPGWLACTVTGEPLARALPNLHEVVHAVAHTRPGTGCTAALEEGLAEYLAGPRRRDRPLSGAPLREQLDATTVSADVYARLGHFVAFLFERFGPEAFAALCLALPPGSELGDWEAASSAILGRDLDALLAEYAAYPECSPQQYRARAWECAGPPDYLLDEWLADGLEAGPEAGAGAGAGAGDGLVLELGCDDLRAMRSRPGEVAITRRLAVAEARTVAIELSIDGRPAPLGSLTIQACGPCSSRPTIHRDAEGPPLWRLEPGIHALALFLDAEQALAGARVRLRIRAPG